MPRATTWDNREVKKLMKDNGFIFDRCRGSHMTFKHADGRIITIPSSYNKMIIRRIIKENNLSV